jgi:hypothetical protein
MGYKIGKGREYPEVDIFIQGCRMISGNGCHSDGHFQKRILLVQDQG